MPAGDFLRIRDALAGMRLDDTSHVLRPLRMVKSEHEVARPPGGARQLPVME
jgi:hypothetical protein